MRVRITVCVTLGQRQLDAERGRGGGEGRHARRQVIGDAERIEPAHLLGDGAVERDVARMDARHIEPVGVRGSHLGDDLVERQGRRVDDARALGRGRDDRLAARASRHKGRPGKLDRGAARAR